MAQQDRNLPEGTDTIVPGASDTDTSDVAGSGSGAPRGSSRSVTRSPKSSGGNAVMSKIRSGGDKLSDQAAGKARDLLGQGMERSAEAIANVGKLVGDTASGLDDRLGADYGDYARSAAQTLENTANRLASKNPDELIDDTREFIRKSPGIALAGAAIVGFALARLVKSGLSRSDNDARDDDSGSAKRRGRS